MPDYKYTVSKDTINIEQLSYEISSNIGINIYKRYPEDTLDGYINFRNINIDNNLKLVFETSLTSQKESHLTAIINNHNINQDLIGQLEGNDRDPTINDDRTRGYNIGDIWINRLKQRSFECHDNSEGAAIWNSWEIEIFNSKKNTMINSLEIQALKETSINNNLSFFIDSFDNDDLIDSNSNNYYINTSEGWVGLDPAGNLNKKDTTKDNFDNAQSFTNTESINDIGGNGAVRKELISAGGQTTLEDFEDTTDVYYNTKSLINSNNFDDGTVGDWIEHLLSDQWDSGIREDYAVGSYGYKLNANDWIESDVFNCTGKSNIKIKFYCNTSELLGSDVLMVGFYDGSSWQKLESISDNQDGYFTVNVPDSYLGSGNKIAFDISDDDTWLDNDLDSWADDSAFIDEVEVYQVVQSQLNQESSPFIIFNGDYSGKYNVDFSKELNSFTIDLTSYDISTEDIIKLYIRKPDSGIYKYRIELQDINDDTWDSGDLDFPDTTNWFTWEKSISTISGIDKANIKYINMYFIEDTSDAVQFGIVEEDSTNSQDFDANDEIIQTFTPTETVTVGRLKMWFKRNSNAPRVPLYVGIANPFGTTYTIAKFTGDQVPTSDFTAAVAELDTELTLHAGTEYRLIFTTTEETWEYKWDIQESSNGYYTDGVYYFNGTEQDNSVCFALLSPTVNEYIYVDDLIVEGESTYELSGSFISRQIDLGVYPDSLDTLTWIEEDNGDILEVRIRLSTTQAGLATASWSAWFSGGTQDITSITSNKWFQYEARFTSGSTTSSSLFKELQINYSVSGGSGDAIVISKEEFTSDIPTKFMLITESVNGTGDINYFISRDGKNTWQGISTFGELTDFTAGLGSSVHLKAIITGNAKLYGWAFLCNEEFI